MAFLILILCYVSRRNILSGDLPETNIIDKKYDITLENYQELFRVIDFKNVDAGKYFSDSILNNYTLKFLKFLQSKFMHMSDEEHMAAVEDYLYSIMEQEKAEEMFKLYQKFREYNAHQYEFAKNISSPENIEEMIIMLHDLHEDRRMFYGSETADALYGEEVKASEYDLRKMLICNNKYFSGAEKEERLHTLKHDMWGEDSSEDLKPWDRYMEKMRIYEDDFNTMTAEEKRDKIKEFRNEFFPPEVTAQLERSDNYIETRDTKINEYRLTEKEILNDSYLSNQEKEAQIKALQKQMYGKYTHLFQLRENYENKFNASLKK